MTKTHRDRSLAVITHVVDLLRAHRAKQNEARLALGPGWQDHDLVFLDAAGGIRTPDAIRHRFHALTAAAGLPRIRLHDLRHTAATPMLANGEHPKVVQERLGTAQSP